MHVALDHPARLHPELDAALGQRQFTLHHQPIVSLDDQSVVGAEALLRWNHPDGRVLLPAEFLSELEATGMLPAVARWTAEEACAAISVVRNETGATLWVAVNAGNRELQDPGFIDAMRAAPGRFELPQGSLVADLTDPAAAAEDRVATEALHWLRDAGVRIALDDAGPGHDELSYLRTLPVDIFRLDPVLIGRLGDRSSAVRIRQLVHQCQELGIEVLAPAIESREQHQAALGAGCTLGQGLLYGPPLTAAELEARVRLV